MPYNDERDERFIPSDPDPLIFINTKLHTYSRLLIDFAVKNRCSTINLINQTLKEKDAVKNPFLLRNWGYYGLKQKLAYKANLFGIKIVDKTG